MRAAYRMAASHRLVPHTGEVEVVVEAPHLASLFEEAARALAELMAEDAPPEGSGASVHVELSARDREALLVDWLNELVYRADVDKRVYGDVTVDRATDTRLEATLRGNKPLAPRTSVKAATWHRLSIAPREGGLRAVFVLDV